MAVKNQKLIFRLRQKNYYLQEKLCCALKKQEASVGNIWMLHQVGDGIGRNEDREYWVSTERFKKNIEEALNQGIRFMSVKDIECSDKSSIFITFDDGYEGVYLNAYPILVQNKIPFTVFITTGFINFPGYITEEQLKEMCADPLCTVGAHTVSHPVLRTLTRADIKDELNNSKAALEKILGIKVLYLAYPYGNISAVPRSAETIAAITGYEYAFSTLQMSIKKSMVKKRYFIPRWNINDANIQYRLRYCVEQYKG